MARTLKILVVGAHPDDADFQFGGSAALYRRQGHQVRFLSVTNGSTGHFCMGGVELARRRAEEARRSGEVLGLEYLVLDIQSGELEPSLPYRKMLIQHIREYRPDLIATHRPCDYHPDHRYTSQLVQDAAYSVTVPGVCPLTPHLSETPVIVYLHDSFRVPSPFRADVVLDIDEVVEKKMDMLHCHTSQMYEWMPYNGGYLAEVPDGPDARREWLGHRYRARDQQVAEEFRSVLLRLYGEARGTRVRQAEAFEVCEYGAPLTADQLPILFPFF
ncbi:MAG: PIG-L family deacetylase [Planctomycetes bacterium]|nr:PIG-L family deacetylase [Planctomycetota bacterium]